MTAPKGGEVIEAAERPDLLAPGTVPRPAWIREQDWARMPWPAKWKAARSPMPRPHDDEDATDGPYRGGPVAVQPCGTYAAYQRHKRAGERPCRACLDANNDRRRQRRIRLGLAVKRDTFDQVLVARFVRGEVPWDELGVEERIAAARRMDAAGTSRNEIARRTRLNTSNLRRAFTALSTGRVDEIRCAPDDLEHAS